MLITVTFEQNGPKLNSRTVYCSLLYIRSVQGPWSVPGDKRGHELYIMYFEKRFAEMSLVFQILGADLLLRRLFVLNKFQFSFSFLIQ